MRMNSEVAGGGFQWGQISMGFASSCGLMQEKRFQFRPVCGKNESPGNGCPSRDQCGMQCRQDGDWDTHWLQRHPCFLSYVDQYTCTYPPNRTIVCWGQDDYLQVQMPVADSWMELDSGFYHACGVLDNGTALCWGNDNYGQATVPHNHRKWVQVAAGGSHSCGLDQDRYLTCWGRKHETQTQVPYPNSFLRVSAGWLHTCAINSDFSLSCWGANDSGQCDVPFLAGTCLGGSEKGKACSTHVTCTKSVCHGKRKHDWEQISCGRLHTCAVDKSNHVFCWGSDQYRQSSMPAASTVTTRNGGHQQKVVNSHGFMTSPCL